MPTLSYVPEAGFDRLFHSRGLSRDTTDRVRRFLRELNPVVYDRYLARYDEQDHSAEGSGGA